LFGVAWGSAIRVVREKEIRHPGDALALSGCDTISGVSRTAAVHKLPDFDQLRARIEGYPEVSKVKFWEREGGRPLTLTGIKKADQVYYLSYSGGEDVRGILTFKRNYNAEVQYNQSLTAMNSRPPQAMIDASWPVMKKIEKDLEENFGLQEITNTLRIRIFRVKDPERMKSN